MSLSLSRLSLALLAQAAALIHLPLAAQTQLAPVVVSGARVALPADRVAADVTVIDAARIQASLADSLEDLLRREAGLQLSRNGAPGSNASVFIRGAGSGNTLVLVDGVRVGSATLGLAEFESLSLAVIERIEVLRGPASSLYGADGSGGVIHISTRRAAAGTQASARLAVGQYGAREGSVHVATRGSEFGAQAALSREQVRGVSALRPGDAFGNFNSDADGMRRTSKSAGLSWQLARAHKLQAGWMDSHINSQYDSSEYLPPTYAQNPTGDFRTRIDQRVATLDWQADWQADLGTLLRLSDQRGVNRAGASEVSRFETQRRQFEAQATWRIAAGQQLTAAIESLREKAVTSNYTAPRRDNEALVLAFAGRLLGADVQLDLRRDDNSAYGGTETGRVGLSLPLGEGWRLRLLGGNSFRAPSFNDLYYPGYGVASIRPERSRSTEAGVEGEGSGWRLGATLFDTRARDLIGYEANPANCPASSAYSFGCARNVASAQLRGLGLSGGLKSAAWALSARFDWLDTEDRQTGQALPRRARQQAQAALSYTPGTWGLSAEALHLGARQDGGKRLGAASTLNLGAHWQFLPQWRVDLQLRNATDADLEPARDYQDLGRQALLTLRWNL